MHLRRVLGSLGTGPSFLLPGTHFCSQGGLDDTAPCHSVAHRRSSVPAEIEKKKKSLKVATFTGKVTMPTTVSVPNRDERKQGPG